MNKYLLFSLAAFICSCGSPICEEDFDIGGVCVRNPENLPIDSRQIERTVEILEEEMQARYPEVEELKNGFDHLGVEVTFFQKYLSHECFEADRDLYACEKLVGGINYDGWRIYISYHKNHNCLGTMSLAHELMHVVEDLHFSDNEDRHTHNIKWLFEQNVENWEYERRDTIEYKTKARQVHEFDECLSFRGRYINVE